MTVHRSEVSSVVAIILVTICLCMLGWQVALPQAAQAQTTPKTVTVKLTWDYDSPPADLAGFRLYQSTTSGQYTYGKGKEVASAPATARTLTLPGVTEGQKYWVLTAFDSNGNESGPSNEASKVIDTTAPGSPGDLQVAVEVVVNVTTTTKDATTKRQ